MKRTESSYYQRAGFLKIYRIQAKKHLGMMRHAVRKEGFSSS
jgi:hypothetical protein